MGLGYLTLDRQVITLSGGELQRLRLAATLDSDLSGIIYILDEPTAGLHPKDTAGMMAVLKNLRDLGNTVLIIEHDVDVMASADYIIDMGPGAGIHGGEVIAAGTLKEIMEQPHSVTGSYLAAPHPAGLRFEAPKARYRFPMRKIQSSAYFRRHSDRVPRFRHRSLWFRKIHTDL